MLNREENYNLKQITSDLSSIKVLFKIIHKCLADYFLSQYKNYY